MAPTVLTAMKHETVGVHRKKLHSSGEDYLEAVLMVQRKSGMARSVDVARQMGVSKPSVSHAVGVLKDGGFLIMDEDGFLHLTEIGLEVAEKIYERHRFFTQHLIVPSTPANTKRFVCAECFPGVSP